MRCGRPRHQEAQDYATRSTSRPAQVPAVAPSIIAAPGALPATLLPLLRALPGRSSAALLDLDAPDGAAGDDPDMVMPAGALIMLPLAGAAYERRRSCAASPASAASRSCATNYPFQQGMELRRLAASSCDWATRPAPNFMRLRHRSDRTIALVPQSHEQGDTLVPQFREVTAVLSLSRMKLGAGLVASRNSAGKSGASVPAPAERDTSCMNGPYS